MNFVLLLIALFAFIRIYPRWAGFYYLLTKGTAQSPGSTPRDYNYTPKVSFMIPSFNEGPLIRNSVESIMASDYPKDKIEINLVDDCSLDDTWEHIQAMGKKYPNNVIFWKNAVNQGKPYTLVDIVQRASGEIVITADSDTIIGPEAIRELVSCYADPEIGGVGGLVRLKNQNATIWTRLMSLQLGLFFYSTKVFENQFFTSRVLCGPIASFRKHIFQEFVPMIKSRNFLGATPIMYGEDAFVTTRISLGNGVKKRWKVYTNFQALAWTDNPETFKAFMNQQLRWWRSQSVGIYVLLTFWSNVMKAGVMPSLIGCMNTISNFLSILLMLYAYLTGTLIQAVVFILIMASISGVVGCVLYNWLIGSKDKVSGPIKNPFTTGIWFGVYNVVGWCALAIPSYFTMDDGGWVTRQNGVQNRG